MHMIFECKACTYIRQTLSQTWALTAMSLSCEWYRQEWAVLDCYSLVSFCGALQVFISPGESEFSTSRALTDAELDSTFPAMVYALASFDGIAPIVIQIPASSYIIFDPTADAAQITYDILLVDTGREGYAVLGNAWTKHMVIQVRFQGWFEDWKTWWEFLVKNKLLSTT